MAGAMELRQIQPNGVIFRQGQKGDAFYVVAQGEASVLVSASHFIKVGQDIRLARDVKIAGRVYQKGTDCTVDKY